MTYPLICISASTQPAVESTVVKCSQCGADLWRSNVSFAETDVEPWCYQCAATQARQQGGMRAEVRPAARLAVVEKLMADDGLSREAAELVVDELLKRMNERPS